MSGAALTHHVVLGGSTFLGDAQPLGLRHCWSGDHLDIGGCQHGSWSSCFRKVLSGLVAKPFFEGVVVPKGPHAVIVRLGPRALGPRPPGLIILHRTVLDSNCLFLELRGPWRWFALLGWRRFESSRAWAS
jgi:hypothetical protein